MALTQTAKATIAQKLALKQFATKVLDKQKKCS
jgi:hypothetical protein